MSVLQLEASGVVHYDFLVELMVSQEKRALRLPVWLDFALLLLEIVIHVSGKL